MKIDLINYLKHCKYDKNLDDKTIKAYNLDLKHFETFIYRYEKEIELSSINKETIRAYLKKISTYAPSTIKRKVASLKAFFNYLEFEDNIPINPFRKLRCKIKQVQKIPSTLSISELHILIKYAYSLLDTNLLNTYKTFYLYRNIAILELLLCTGMRVSEVCNIKFKNFGRNFSSIKVLGKGRKERIIPITNSNTVSALQSYSKIVSGNNEYFFTNRLKKKISPQSIRMTVKEYAIKSSLNPKITPHIFRHSFATILLENEVDIRYIQNLLGHSCITTTQIYTRVCEKRKQEILSKKNPRNFIALSHE